MRLERPLLEDASPVVPRTRARVWRVWLPSSSMHRAPTWRARTEGERGSHFTTACLRVTQRNGHDSPRDQLSSMRLRVTDARDEHEATVRAMLLEEQTRDREQRQNK